MINGQDQNQPIETDDTQKDNVGVVKTILQGVTGEENNNKEYIDRHVGIGVISRLGTRPSAIAATTATVYGVPPKTTSQNITNKNSKSGKNNTLTLPPAEPQVVTLQTTSATSTLSLPSPNSNTWRVLQVAHGVFR